MKETFYFPHDYGARNDPKLQKLLRELGHEGKSVFWDIIEMLFENGGRLELAECDSYAFALRTQCDIIKRVVNDFNLFQNDGQFFWSNSVLSRLKDREEKSEKARKSAEKRWYNANAMQTHSERNAKKEKKGKEKKESKEKEDSTFLSLAPPELLLVSDFETAWGEWLEYRRVDLKKPVTEFSAKQQFKFLKLQPNPVAVIRESIRNTWQGLFPQKSLSASQIKTNGINSANPFGGINELRTSLRAREQARRDSGG